MPTVSVALGERSYPIVVEPGALARAGELIAGQARPRSVLLVSHLQIAERYAAPILSALEALGIPAWLVLVPAGDRTKSLRMLSRVVDEAVAHRLERSSAMVALGGGVIGDLTGFAASIYLRGVSFIQVPTSLLAQVDASVGGKTAVNHPAGKNLIGTFYQPRLVVIDPAVLSSLSAREMRSGLAEMIKHGVILDDGYFASLERAMPALLRNDLDAMTEAIAGSCRLKAEVVASDERESGRRALLNYGHTFGHALETVTHFRRYKHGEAVSIGMEMAAAVAQSLGILSGADAARQAALLREAGLPTRIRGKFPSTVAGVMGAMELDKKVAAGRVRFVLADRIGHGGVHGDVPREVVEDVCRRFLPPDAMLRDL